MSEPWQDVIFWTIAVVMGISAFRVVTTRNVVHAALWLVSTLLGAAVLYVLLFAEFLGWAQVLVYVGAVVVLMLFGLMLTRAPIGAADFDNDQRWLALLAALAVFGITTWVILDAFKGQRIDLVLETGQAPQVTSVGNEIFSNFVLPFEAASVLLLAALIGAVVIARRDDPADFSPQPYTRVAADTDPEPEPTSDDETREVIRAG
jgi:NADH-quinone oxidoreductase subunit J